MTNESRQSPYSGSNTGGSNTKQTKRPKSNFGRSFFLLLLFLSVLAISGVGLFAPVRLALAQEQVLGLLHGGVVSSEEVSYVDGCVRIKGLEAAQAIARVHRTTTFKDGTTLEIIFSERPVPTNVTC